MEEIEPTATEMYLGHVEHGMKKHYALRDWGRLERALIEMGARLKDVLPRRATPLLAQLTPLGEFREQQVARPARLSPSILLGPWIAP